MRAYNMESSNAYDDNRIMLSVIVPVYNSEKYVGKCLDSILNQTEKKLEIICVDDGSSDNSGVILDEYAQKDNRIIVIHKDNGGLVSARKAGLQKATGEYVAHVDSDDWIEADMYSKAVRIICDYSPDVICTGIIRDYGDTAYNEPCTIAEGLYEGATLKNEILSQLIDVNCFMKYKIGPHLVTKIAKRDHLRKHYYSVPDTTDICEDLVSSYPMLLDSDSVYICSECFYHYVSISGSMVNKVQIDKYASLSSTYEYFRLAINEYMTEIPALEDQYRQLRLFDILCVAPDHIMKYENNELYPFGRIEPATKIIIYGAGGFGKSVKRYIESNTDLQIVAWADKQGDGIEIIRPEQIAKVDYDIIIIGVLLYRILQSIIKDLLQQGIDKSKILVLSEQKSILNDE